MNGMDRFIERIKNRVIDELTEEGYFSPPRIARTLMGEKAVAEFLGVKAGTVSRWMREGDLQGCYQRIGKDLYFDISAIDKKFKK